MRGREEGRVEGGREGKRTVIEPQQGSEWWEMLQVFTDLRWVNDSCELLDPEHAQVGDGERPSLELMGLQLASPGPLG